MRRRSSPTRRARSRPATAADAAPRPLPGPEPGQQHLLARLEDDAARHERELRAAHDRIRELEQLVSVLRTGLVDVRGDIERVAESRAWRLGHGATLLVRRVLRRRTTTAGAVARALERLDRIEKANAALPAAPPEPAPLRPIAPQHDPVAVLRAEGPARAELAGEVRRRLGPPPEREDWPTVTIVVISRDGHEHLRRLLLGLREHTDYPAFDVVVVDNASEAPLAAVVAQEGAALDVRVEVAPRHLTFSEANNLGAAEATGDVLLFLNDDVEPFEPGWLRELIATLEEPGSGAAGATLLHVAHDPKRSPSGWFVQHRGVRFKVEDGLPRAFNDGDGDDVFDTSFGMERAVPAVTAAAVAVPREHFTAVGGFTVGYRFGTEDVDLCLKLRDHGLRVSCSGRTLLFHRESTTQARVARTEIRDNRLVNRRLFHERWGPLLHRELRRARLAGDRFWTDERAHIGITLSSNDPADGWGDWPTAHELGDALEERGLRVTYLQRRHDDWRQQPHDLDAVIALMDPFDARSVRHPVPVVAWIRNWTDRWMEREWFPAIDTVLASSGITAELLAERAGVPSVRFPLAANVERFRPNGGRPALDYVLTANRWGAERAIEKALSPGSADRFALVGRGWEDVPELARYSRGPSAYEDLPAVYADAKLVLDDTAGPTLPYGAVNARVFDGLASGSLVITNCEAGVRELFDEDFPTWSHADDLRETIHALLRDDERRTALVRRYRRTVLAEHTYRRRAQTLHELLHRRNEALSFCVKIGAPDRERASRWGDLYFAQSLCNELRRRGHRAVTLTLDEWDGLDALTFDVAITLRGLSAADPKPGQVNVLWNISHPEALTGVECDAYDLVAVASRPHAEALARRTATKVVLLEQATDPFVFRPTGDGAAPERDLVFVGNSRRVRRRALDWLLPTTHDLAVYGGDWKGIIDDRYVVADFVPNQELHRVYGSAKLVLADHWDDMREAGYISNRIFDALASGAVVVSDEVAGLDERFEGIVATYDSPERLEQVIAELLADDGERRRRRDAGLALVARDGLFAHRVDTLLAELVQDPRLAGRLAPSARVPS